MNEQSDPAGVRYERAAPYDVLVVGGGPAGLAAALMLGRCRRSVLVCDDQRPRNARSRALHGYPTRDGIAPAQWLEACRAELARYPSVECLDVKVVDARREGRRFELELHGRGWTRTRKLLIATGVRDELPRIEGLQAFYGRSVFHCPYCDGFEMSGRRLAVYAKRGGEGLALDLLAWSRDVVLCTDGCRAPSGRPGRELERAGIRVEREPIQRLVGRDGALEEVEFVSGKRLARQALFFATDQFQRSELGVRLGCRFERNGAIRAKGNEATSVRGVFVAGDASGGEQLVVVAAAEGTRAAIAIHREITLEDRANGSGKAEQRPGLHAPTLAMRSR